MILVLDDWKFDVDIAATMDHSSSEAADHCTCGYCRNFYSAVDCAYPELRPFLAQFGVDVEGPDEMIPYDPPTECEAYYADSGRILEQGRAPLSVNGLNILPQLSEEVMVNTSLTDHYFFLLAGLMSLPWVLDEPMEDVASPANESWFLNCAWDRIFRRLPKDSVSS